MEAFVTNKLRSLSDLPEKIRSALLNAERVVAFTGAGISAESGIPTFRGKEGLWTKFRPEELASVSGFLSNPSLVWAWYQERRRIIAEAQPNPAHIALAEMEKLYPHVVIITQNVDRLHHRAGSTTIIELHGNIEENYCIDCAAEYNSEIDVTEQQPPRCPQCGGLIRPAVVWFGELLPEEEFRRAEEEAQSADVFFSIGTSAEVYPAAQLPFLARTHGALLIEINPDPTMISEIAHLIIRSSAATALPALVEAIKKEKESR